MNYIWDIVLKAKQNGIPKMDLFFEQGKDISPYYEQAFSCLDQKNIENTNIEINALYRFDELFAKYLHEDFLKNLEFKKYFFDLVIHFLCEIDLAKGISKESLYLAQIEDEINLEVFGQKMNFKAFEPCHNLLPLVLKQLRTGSSLGGFREALTRIYPNTLVYQIKDEPQKLLIYLGINQTEKESQKLQFITEMFLPLEFNTRIFWDKHFGVFGASATLTMNEIELI